MKENIIKTTVSAAIGGLCAYLGKIVIPVAILALLMALDYCTGLVKAWMTGTLSSRTGIRGILKKVGYLAVIITGMAVDWVLREGFSAVGIAVKFDFLFSLIITVWLIVNECISILENVAAAGVPVPKFLLKITEKLKNTIEEKGRIDGENK